MLIFEMIAQEHKANVICHSHCPLVLCLQVISVSGETKTALELKACVNYTVQVRCSSRSNPPLWSSWSESHHIFLDGKNRFLGFLSKAGLDHIQVGFQLGSCKC